MGADVDMYYFFPNNKFFKKQDFFLEKYSFLKKNYFEGIIKKNVKDKEYDYLFVINAAIFPEYFYKRNKGIANL